MDKLEAMDKYLITLRRKYERIKVILAYQGISSNEVLDWISIYG